MKTDSIRPQAGAAWHQRLVGPLMHALAHKMGWNKGRVETWYEEATLMVGFRCECGEMMHSSPCHIPYPEAPGSTELINRAKTRFAELGRYKFDWRSFHNGFMEGAIPAVCERGEMLRLIDDMLTMFREDSTTSATEERVEAWRTLRASWPNIALSQPHEIPPQK